MKATKEEALKLLRDQWARKTQNTHGGYCCWGLVDGTCGAAHESLLTAMHCLMRFRWNAGGGFSDRVILSGATGEPVDVLHHLAGCFSERGAHEGRPHQGSDHGR